VSPQHPALGLNQHIRADARVGGGACVREILVELRVAPARIVFRRSGNKVAKNVGCVGDVGIAVMNAMS